MKHISYALQAHINGELTTVVELIKITRTDGVVIGLTTHDKDIEIENIIYKAEGSFEAGKIESDTKLQSNDYDVKGILSSALISKEALSSGLYDYARIDVYLCNWQDITQGVIHLRRGWIGTVTFVEGQYVAALRGFGDLLSRRIGETYTPECRFDLGKTKCGVDLESMAVTGAVTSIVDKCHFKDSSRTEENAYFSGAKLTWTSGLNEGASMEVNAWNLVEYQFTLWVPTIYAIQVGDTYAVTPGCDKRFSTCKDRFSNAANFGGFPHLPGLGTLLTYPDR